jgi:hypothetical protein
LNGSATDVFVIKTASTLTTGAGGGATVALTGGALAKNVYWIIGSSATLNITGPSVFRGNVIAQVSITVTSGGSSDVRGSLIALTGAITFSAATTVEVQSQAVSNPSMNIGVYIREPVKQVFLAEIKTDASNLMINFNQANISIVDSKGGLSGYDEFGNQVSDQGIIQLNQYPGSSFPVNDVIRVVYKTQSHL